METKKKRPLADILINIIYVMAMAMDRMIRVTEILMLKEKHGWKHEKKMRFKEMIRCAERIKALNNVLDYEDYDEACKEHGEYYQYYQEDAYKLCRFLLFFCDRDAVSEDNSNETFKLMRSQEGTGNIGEEELKFFYLNK
jgi:hypothetical protein